jgi:recombinational DNA repair ATPase RecF
MFFLNRFYPKELLILDQIHSLSLGKSFRTNNKKEMVKNGKNSFLLRGFFKNAQGNESMVSFSQDRLGNKKIKINKKNR